VVVIGIPILAVLLVIGWFIVRKNVMAHTNGRIKAVWSNDGPTYGDDVTADDLDPAENGEDEL
jgi:L-asparagine permease